MYVSSTVEFLIVGKISLRRIFHQMLKDYTTLIVVSITFYKKYSYNLTRKLP